MFDALLFGAEFFIGMPSLWEEFFIGLTTALRTYSFFHTPKARTSHFYEFVRFGMPIFDIFIKEKVKINFAAYKSALI